MAQTHFLHLNEDRRIAETPLRQVVRDSRCPSQKLQGGAGFPAEITSSR